MLQAPKDASEPRAEAMLTKQQMARRKAAALFAAGIELQSSMLRAHPTPLRLLKPPLLN